MDSLPIYQNGMVFMHKVIRAAITALPVLEMVLGRTTRISAYWRATTRRNMDKTIVKKRVIENEAAELKAQKRKQGKDGLLP